MVSRKDEAVVTLLTHKHTHTHTHTEVVSRKNEAVVTLYAQSDADRNDWVHLENTFSH